MNKRVPQSVMETLMDDKSDATRINGETIVRLVSRKEDEPHLVAKKYHEWTLGAAILEDAFPTKIAIIDVGESDMTRVQAAMCFKLFPKNFPDATILPRPKRELKPLASKAPTDPEGE
jgi:hypothetical protein